MTESEVRTMLKNYRTDSAKIEWWFEHKGKETEAEFFEAEQTGAVDYGKDKVQTSSEIDGSAIGLICRKDRKIEQEEPDELIAEMYADRLRLHGLECAVYRLQSNQYNAIHKMYLEGKPFIKVQFEMNYGESQLYKIISDAIREIARTIIIDK